MKNTLLSTKADSFSSLTVKGDELILTNKKKEETPILISKLHKIYIAKRQLSFIFKLCINLIPMFVIAVFYSYFSTEIILFGYLLLFIPLFVGLNKYKWYQLIILLNDETFYIKTFYVKTKYEHINLVNVVKKEIYDYCIKSNFQPEKQSPAELEETNYLLPSINIA